ncbi:hypothetical protein GN958_ATG23378 [Phytophthora infestans]|uniref:Uncharacterized protein n=1 Tax=Phytophthora infestans TaxID=4787 RepID=A0A8S9TN44_PHYIN|nr:hypothetical protein GN958_ATG23378 [Phytophthora infestans]
MEPQQLFALVGRYFSWRSSCTTTTKSTQIDPWEPSAISAEQPPRLYLTLGTRMTFMKIGILPLCLETGYQLPVSTWWQALKVSKGIYRGITECSKTRSKELERTDLKASLKARRHWRRWRSA